MTHSRWWLAAVVVLMALALPVAEEPPIVDPAATRHLPPGSRRTELTFSDGRVFAVEELEERGGALCYTRLGEKASIDATQITGRQRRRFWLGTDRLGRDLLLRVGAATRRSIVFAGSGALLCALLGVAIGSAIGRLPRSGRTLASRSIDLWASIPALFVVLAVGARDPLSPGSLAVLLALLRWPAVARLARARVLELAAAPFVEAAVATGIPRSRLLVTQLAPHLLPVAIAAAALIFGELLLAEATLSFLGAGLPPHAPGLGGLLEWRHPSGAQAWPLGLPAAVLALLVSVAFAGARTPTGAGARVPAGQPRSSRPWTSPHNVEDQPTTDLGPPLNLR